MSRILFVTQTHNVWGGMEQWLHHFSAWLQQRGWDVYAALPHGRRFNDARAYLREHPHLRPVLLDVRDGTERSRDSELVRAIEQTRPDLVIPIASGAVFAAVARARARGSRARLLVPIRSLHPDLFCNLAEHGRIVDQVVAVSRLSEAMIVELLPQERDRIAYVRHGARPPHRSRVPSGALRAGFVGRLEQSTKRVFDLADLAHRETGAELHVYGSGPDEEELRGRLVDANVTLHGRVTQADLYDRVYPSLDVLLLFSPAEGSPNAVYEAMRNGVVPVIASYLGQAAEGIVRHGENGVVFDVGDIDAAALALRSLSSDRDRWTALSSAAERRVDSDERMHADWERILERTVARPPKPPAAVPPIDRAGGTLDRLLPSAAAAWLRRALGREFPHASGWGEWPGTAPASADCIAAVERRLRALDEASREAD